MSPPAGALVAVLITAFAVGVERASAHCGVLHPSRPSVANNVRAAVATCGTWAPMDPALSPVAKSLAADASQSPPSITVKGPATLWMFLRKNCSGAVAVGLELDIVLTGPEKQPPQDLFLDGYVHTEACSAGGRARYFFYPTLRPLNDLRNMIFMRDIPVPATNGSVAGNMANDGPMRVATARSFILYDSNTSVPLACCDLAPQGSPDTPWDRVLDGQGKECNASFARNDCPLPLLDPAKLGAEPSTAAAAAAAAAAPARSSAAATGGVSMGAMMLGAWLLALLLL